MVDLVTVVDRAVVLERPSLAGWIDVARRLRRDGYDVAIDFQGLMKSAVLARASGRGARHRVLDLAPAREDGPAVLFRDGCRERPAAAADTSSARI